MVRSSLSALLLLSSAVVPSVAAARASTNWFTELENTLGTLQNNFFNGSYWPQALQWQNAVLGTFLASSEISFTNALQEYNGNVPGASTSASSIQALIQKYYAETEAYYAGEDANEIFMEAYDDAQWVVLEWLEVLKFIGQYDAYANSNLGKADIANFAHRAHIFYNIVQDKYDTTTCSGGITWNPKLQTYKNAITNELLISSSVKMYMYYPGDSNSDPYPTSTYQSSYGNLPSLPALAAHAPLLLDNAKKEYQWFKTHNFTNSQGLIVDGFHISSGQTSCDQRNEMVYTYNQGVMLEGLRDLWEVTGDATYLTDGYAYIKSAMNATGWGAPASQNNQWSGLGRNGIMEDYCDADGSCSNDAMLFKGIYFHNLDEFCTPLPTDKPLIQGITCVASASLAQQHASTCAGYTPWVQHNAQAAISTRDSSGVIGGWWSANSVNQSTPRSPPRPYNSTDVWNEPWVLTQPPWKCNGKYGCQGNFQFNGSPAKRFNRFTRGAQVTTQRTAQTQGSGLGVVNAASDFGLKRPAS